MIQFFIGIWKWLTDPKNKTILRLLLVISLIALILMQCSHGRELKTELEQQKSETERTKNNYEALHSPLTQSKINDSTLRAEKLALKLTIDELKKGYSDLLVGFESFKKQTPKLIEKITFNNTEAIREVPVHVKMDGLGNGIFTFNDSAKFKDGNSRTLSGILPFSSLFFNKKDSTQADINKLGLYTQVNPGHGDFILEQNVRLKVGLFEDPKTKKVIIAATTSYPGIKFSQLDGADIMSDESSKKVTRQFRKTWGIGLNLGYGIVVDLKSSKVYYGPQTGISLTYTPKWLQWGK